MSREGERKVDRSLRAELERDRFGRRRRRVDMVLSVLRERAAERERARALPKRTNAAATD